MFQRSIAAAVRRDLEKKIVLLSGPRQVGKTVLSKGLFPASHIYLNFDDPDSRQILRARDWPRDRDLLVLDEIHKMKGWKRWVKGLYDVEGVRPRLLVTGSARLDVQRKGGESLAGRHFLHRLHPLSVSELKLSGLDVENSFHKLLRYGGFPEPLSMASDEEVKRWRKSHLDRILKDDLIELERVRDLKSVEILVDLLSERVGSSVSYLSLARDLEVSPHTVKRWVQILEAFFIVFVVTPYSKNIAKALLKEPKIYFYDIGRVRGSDAAKFENLVASSLLKRNHFLEDTKGDSLALHYVRDKEKREVDFLVTRERAIEMLVEVKWADESLSPSLRYFEERLKPRAAIQLVAELKRERQLGSCRILRAAPWLAGLET